MSVQAKKSNLEICSAKGWPHPTYRRERQKISVTTFPSECKIAINNNNTEQLFDRDLHPNNGLWDARQCFYSKSRNVNIETSSSSFFSSFFFYFFYFTKLSRFVWKTRAVQRWFFHRCIKYFFIIQMAPRSPTVKNSKPNIWQPAVSQMVSQSLAVLAWDWSRDSELYRAYCDHIKWPEVVRVLSIFVNNIDKLKLVGFPIFRLQTRFIKGFHTRQERKLTDCCEI